MGALVDDVRALVAEVGAPVHLVGHDWGSAVGWALAAAHPEALRSFTAVSLGHPRALVRAMRRPAQARRSWYIAAFGVPRLPELVLSGARGVRALRASGMDEEALARFSTEIVADGALRPALNWYRGLLVREPGRGFGSPVGVPTSYLWSRQDTALGRQAAEATAAHVRGPYRFVEADGSHWLPDQQPDLVAEVVLDRVRSLH